MFAGFAIMARFFTTIIIRTDERRKTERKNKRFDEPIHHQKKDPAVAFIASPKLRPQDFAFFLPPNARLEDPHGPVARSSPQACATVALLLL